MLANVISAIGTEHFYKTLFTVMRTEINACQLVAHRFKGVSPYQMPKKIEPLAVEADDSASCLKRVNEYIEKLYSSDPFLNIITAPTATANVKVEAISTEQMAHNEYRERLFSSSELAGKISLILRLPEDALSISIYRKNSQGSFSANEITRISDMGAILTAALERHCSLKRDASGDITSIAKIFSGLSLGKPLSDRESAICAYITLGYSNLAISLHLDVSIHTVSTYRRRAYAKLNVTSQAEVFNLLLKHMH